MDHVPHTCLPISADLGPTTASAIGTTKAKPAAVHA
jgi:hypothetical protein